MYTVTVNQIVTGTTDTIVTFDVATLSEAETLVNKMVAEYIEQGSAHPDLAVTGGRLADWKNVTLYLGSTDFALTITTARTRNVR